MALWRIVSTKTPKNLSCFSRAFHILGDGSITLDLPQKSELSSKYDLVVIGGGSGGISCAREAASLGKKVAILDAVAQSVHGKSWGLGGTCVNVGCIPKKLMHQAGLLGRSIQDAREFGWMIDKDPKHDWNVLVQNIRNYISSLNFGYFSAMLKENVDYIHAWGYIQGPNTIKCVSPPSIASNKQTENDGDRVIQAEHIVIAVGERPVYPDIPGAREYCISSDEIFSLENSPGKTLVIGGSYVALECAGFLTELGYDTTVMYRSIPLRGFDQQMASMVVEYMENHETKFLKGTIPTRVSKTSNKIKVDWENASTQTGSDEFDTVLVATGRRPIFRMGFENVNVELDKDTNQILVDDNLLTSCPTIYAVGDAVASFPQLTPVAIHAGKMLAKHIVTGQTMDLSTINTFKVPTTVFTPLEYSCVGLSEEMAIQQLGKVEVYHSALMPLEWTIANRVNKFGQTEKAPSYFKIICEPEYPQKVVGIHILSPVAGEIMQGFATAFRLGITKADLDMTIGIHPTLAEEMVLLNKTKSSGISPVKTSC